MIDFDGTCVAHLFPGIGRQVGSIRVLKRLVAHGHQLILFTMRSDVEAPTSNDPNVICERGTYLTDAVNWFEVRGIPLYGIQTNPTQGTWTSSPKAYGELMIDDSAIGCPLIMDDTISDRPFVNWLEVERLLEVKGLFNTKYFPLVENETTS